MGNGFIMQIRGGGTTGGETDADFSLNPRFTFIKKKELHTNPHFRKRPNINRCRASHVPGGTYVPPMNSPNKVVGIYTYQRSMFW